MYVQYPKTSRAYVVLHTDLYSVGIGQDDIDEFSHNSTFHCATSQFALARLWGQGYVSQLALHTYIEHRVRNRVCKYAHVFLISVELSISAALYGTMRYL